MMVRNKDRKIKSTSDLVFFTQVIWVINFRSRVVPFFAVFRNFVHRIGRTFVFVQRIRHVYA